MIQAEFRLQYKIEHETPDYHELVEVSCPTELANIAYNALRKSGADNVNFAFVSE